MHYQSILDDIAEAIRPQLGQHGKVADHIPALAQVPVERFGIALRTRDGEEAWAGDAREAFTIQSVSKLFALTLAMRYLGDELWQRIGREPSGDPFNSLVQLEFEQGIPRNPFINAGAIAVSDRLASHGDADAEVLSLLSSLCDEALQVDEEVARSELDAGYRNLALASLMKDFGKIDNPIPQVLEAYFRQCSIRMDCLQLARAAGYLCRRGGHPYRPDEEVVTDRQARRLNALMLTCGTYDAAGEFAFRVGLPCKSGVGGGIVAVVPDRLSLCVWSPALDENGNSFLGMQALEMFVAKTRLSVF
ncbi:MAG: glutaminase [Xylophilus ampelinus]